MALEQARLGIAVGGVGVTGGDAMVAQQLAVLAVTEQQAGTQVVVQLMAARQ